MKKEKEVLKESPEAAAQNSENVLFRKEDKKEVIYETQPEIFGEPEYKVD